MSNGITFTTMLVFIEKISFGGYKSINNVEVNFKRGLNLVIGPNGAGKTNFLNFLHKSIRGYADGIDQFKIEILYTIIKEGQLFQEEVHHIKSKSRIIPFKTNFKKEVSLSYSINDSSVINESRELEQDQEVSDFFEHLFALKAPLPNFSTVFFQHNIPESLAFLSKPGQYTFNYDWGMIHGLPDSKRSTIFERYILDVYAWDILEKLKKGTKRNLKDVERADLAEELVDDFRRSSQVSLDDKLSYLLTEFTHIAGIRVASGITTKWIKNESFSLGNIFLEFKIDDEWYRWDSLSDGTQRLLLMISTIHSYNSGIMLIEEPELGIHPHQLDRLMNFLKEEAESKQIIVTTHSPQVLDILDEEDIDRIIIAQYSDNQTEIKNINEEQIQKALIYTRESFLSDFWRHTDELKL
ncbi:MAG: ATP-binding protein [Ekhidna sp.]|uniref:AAA family ATPase n=1 Tax=Ekhidna sp. TaxID=2608089 RepID=UPI0032EF3855